MKSFKEYCLAKTDPDGWNPTREEIYNAGASELRKSLICRTCIKHLNCPIQTILGMGVENESISNKCYDNFGCKFHQEKEEKP